MQQFIDKLISRLEEKAEIEREECKKLAESKLIEFVAKYNHGEYCYVNAINIVNQLAEEYKPRTNADKVREMTDEELAELLGKCCCVTKSDEDCIHFYDDEVDCNKCVREWLQSEVKDGD